MAAVVGPDWLVALALAVEKSWCFGRGLCVRESNNDWNAQRYVPTFQGLPLPANAPNNNFAPEIGC